MSTGRFPPAFERSLPFGVCVAVRVPGTIGDAELSELPAEERAFAQALAPARRRTWAGGRAAIRAAARRAGTDVGAVLATDRGAPALPRGVRGSISHKRDLAIALVAVFDREEEWDRTFLGIDLEADVPTRVDLARRVLTDAERAALATADAVTRGRQTLLSFSLKEAVYKAIDPVLRRAVSFKEVAVTPGPSGVAQIDLMLADGAHPGHVEAYWTDEQGWLVATARLVVPDPGPFFPRRQGFFARLNANRHGTVDSAARFG